MSRAKRNGKAPWWASPDLASRMTGVVKVMCMGHNFEIPVTPDTMPFILLLKGDSNPWPKRARDWRRRATAEKGMRDIIDAIYLQVRDRVGAEVTRDLSQEISEKLEPLLARRVDREIVSRSPDVPRLVHGKPDR